MTVEGWKKTREPGAQRKKNGKRKAENSRKEKKIDYEEIAIWLERERAILKNVLSDYFFRILFYRHI